MFHGYLSEAVFGGMFSKTLAGPWPGKYICWVQRFWTRLASDELKLNIEGEYCIVGLKPKLFCCDQED